MKIVRSIEPEEIFASDRCFHCGRGISKELVIGCLSFCPEHAAELERSYASDITLAYLTREMQLYADRASENFQQDTPLAPLLNLFVDATRGDFSFVAADRGTLLAFLYLAENDLLHTLSMWSATHTLSFHLWTFGKPLKFVDKLVRTRLKELDELKQEGILPEDERRAKQAELRRVLSDVQNKLSIFNRVVGARDDLLEVDEDAQSKAEKLQNAFERGLVSPDAYERGMQTIEATFDQRASDALGQIPEARALTEGAPTAGVSVFFKCKHCGVALRAPASKMGGKGRCKKCRSVVDIPSLNEL